MAVNGIVIRTSFSEQLNELSALGKLYVRRQFTGGGSDALDGIDGANLQNGEGALVINGGNFYFYEYIEGATDTENPPYVIAPDTNANGRWFLRNVSDADKLDGFHASQNPSANMIPVLDGSGVLNLPFTQVPIKVNGQDLMSRTFYVDQVNGDDSNDGSESAPFRTLQKAVDSIPVGGMGVIKLMSDYEVTDHTETVWIYSKHIHISLEGHRLRTTVDSSSGFNKLRLVFYNFASLLAFYLGGTSQIILDDDGYDPSEDWYAGRRKLISCSAEDLDLGFLGRSQVSIIARYMQEGVPFLVIKKGALVGYKGGVGEYTVDGFDVGVVALDGESKVVIDGVLMFVDAPVNFHWYVETVEDSNGNSVDIKDKILGIVRDANGVPRNVISNLVL